MGGELRERHGRPRRSGSQPAHGPIETGDGPFGIAVTPAAVWVTNQVDRTVAQIDPRTNQRTGRAVRVGRGPRGVTVGEGAVWVATGEGKGVSRVDLPSRSRRARQIRLGRFCHDVAVAGGSVWATNPYESTVMRIDPETNRRAGAPISVPGGPTTIEFGFGFLWVAGEAGTLTRIDPRTGKTGRQASRAGRPDLRPDRGRRRGMGAARRRQGAPRAAAWWLRVARESPPAAGSPSRPVSRA